LIPIRNIYYMLSYAFCVLNEKGYQSILTEPFSNAADLYAAILVKGIATQLKRGLGREYINQKSALSFPRGKLDITASVKTKVITKKQLVCSYDDFSTDTYMNRILKTTMMILLRLGISKVRMKEIRKLLVYFIDITPPDINTIRWNLQYNNRNTQTYRMLISVCYLVVKGLLQSKTDGTTQVMDFIDEQRMCRLYEKFILEYYRREYKALNAIAAQIPWQLDDDSNDMLPLMQTDILLTHGEKTLIIDAKYYENTTQKQYGVDTIHSGNLYQIFTYVKNKDAELSGKPHEVAGMLLYAKPSEATELNQTYRMSGNTIFIRTLDLNCDFKNITQQLDNIVCNYFIIQKSIVTQTCTAPETAWSSSHEYNQVADCMK
jgi:5-methylcytosine-specific restriction enzyme subunit McrC